jgi:hypothetical protein
VKLNSGLTPLPSGPIPFPLSTSSGQSRPDPLSVPSQWQAILTTTETDALTIKCDGSYDPGTSSATFSWTFYGQHTICKGTGSIDDMNRNPYRAELYSILAALTVLLQAESGSPTYTGGTATLISNCQKGLRNALSPGPAGVKEATQDEYDLIMEIC